MTDQLLIIFVKNPELGKAKTRLAQTIGNDKALAIYKLLLAKTKEVVFDLPFDIQIHYTAYIDQDDQWENDRFNKALQLKADLGEKMQHAFDLAFEQEYQQVCIIGSDCYDLTTETIGQAFTVLEENDHVIGPSVDGGYYLLGMKKLESSLFENKQWSTETVFNDTLKDFERLKSSYFTLPKISDVDVEADLGEWANEIMNS